MSSFVGQCDCCAAYPVRVTRLWAYGIETFACAKCRGEDEDAYDEAPPKCPYTEAEIERSQAMLKAILGDTVDG